MKKHVLFAILLAALLFILPAAVYAAEEQAEAPAASETEKSVAAAFTEVGRRRLPVTSAASEGAGDLKLAGLFDGRADTGVKVDLSVAEDRTFTLYTSSGVPQILTSFGILTDGVPGTLVTLHVYGTNDSTAVEWTPLPLIQSVDKQGDFRVFHIQNTAADWKSAAAYTFYKFTFTVEPGENDPAESAGFNLREVVLLRPESDEPDMKWAVVDAVEPGEFPPLVPVKTEEESVETAAAPAETAEPAAEEPAEDTKPLWNNFIRRGLFGPFGFGAYLAGGR